MMNHRPEGYLREGLLDWWDIILKETPDITSMLEVGSATGDSLELHLEKVPNMNVTVIDPWYDPILDSPYGELGHQMFLKRFGNKPNIRIIRSTSEKAHLLMGGFIEKWDVIYIDAVHEEPFVEYDIKKWWKFLKLGGWIGGHDYLEQPWGYGVIAAVNKLFGKPDFVTKDTSWLIRKTEEDIKCRV